MAGEQLQSERKVPPEQRVEEIEAITRGILYVKPLDDMGLRRYIIHDIDRELEPKRPVGEEQK